MRSCQLASFGLLVACRRWLLNNLTLRNMVFWFASQSWKRAPDLNPSRVMTEFPWALYRSQKSSSEQSFHAMASLRELSPAWSSDYHQGSIIILRQWKSLLCVNSLNILRTVTYVSSVNKAQMRNGYLKICFAVCSTGGSACTPARNNIKPTSRMLISCTKRKREYNYSTLSFSFWQECSFSREESSGPSCLWEK